MGRAGEGLEAPFTIRAGGEERPGRTLQCPPGMGEVQSGWARAAQAAPPAAATLCHPLRSSADATFFPGSWDHRTVEWFGL